MINDMFELNKKKMSISNDKKLSFQVLGKVNFLMPIVEAVVNSIQAGANDIKIQINRVKITPDDKLIEQDVINKIEIQDDGNGFLLTDRESFNKICGTKKSNCKGLGRLSYLQVFDDISINSIFNENQEWKELNFKYNGEDLIKDENIKRSSQQYKKTTVCFQSIHKDYANDITKTDEQIFNALKREIIPTLINKKCKVTVNNSYNVDLSENTLQEIPVDNPDYRIQYTYYNSTTNAKQDNFFLLYAKDRAICDVFQSNPSFEFNDDSNKKIIILASHKLFDIDGAIKPDWSGFTIDNSQMNPIKEKIQNAIYSFLEDKTTLFDSIKKWKDEIVRKRPDLKSFLNKDLDSKVFTNEGEILKALKDKESETFDKMYSEGSQEMFSDNIDSAQASALAKLMITRFRTLENAYSICNNKDVLEKDIHNVLFTQRTNSDTVKDNNLWLLDARWQYSKHIESDNSIDDVVQSIQEKDIITLFKEANLSISGFEHKYNSEHNQDIKDQLLKRPDIAIFNEDSLVIVELKKPKLRLNDFIQKPKLYASLLGYKTKYKFIYCYLIGSENPTRNDDGLNDSTWVRTIDGLGFFSTPQLVLEDANKKDITLNDVKCYYEVCNYNKFLKDCYMQHHQFFEKIGKKIEALDKYIPQEK